MTINKFNYEAFALDYLEGKLSVELTEEMERFLATHPAIEAELSGMMEVVYLEPDTSIVFEDKAALLKEEKVVWFNKKWVRPLIAAASVAILLMTYFSGYQAGVEQGDNRVVVNEEKESNGSSSSIVADARKTEGILEEETLELPVIEETKLEKTVVKFVPKSMVQPKSGKDSRAVVGNGALEEIIINELINIVAEKLQVVENELVEPVLMQEIAASKELIRLTPIASIKPNLVHSISHDNSLSNLSNALDLAVPVEELAGITIQKKKRSFKDLLGRFPVTQLKEALIPTYYREENAGQ